MNAVENYHEKESNGSYPDHLEQSVGGGEIENQTTVDDAYIAPKRTDLKDWRRQDDSVLDIEMAGKKVRDHLQEYRDEQALILRGKRKQRDEKRQGAEQKRKEAGSLTNNLLKPFRGKDHPLHPEVLKDQAREADRAADSLQKQAKDSNFNFKVGQDYERKKLLIEAVGDILDPLREMQSAIYACDNERFQSLLDSLRTEQLKKIINSDYKQEKYSQQSVSEIALTTLADVQRGLSQQDSFKFHAAKRSFDTFLSGLLVEESKGEAKIYKDIKSIFPLLSSINHNVPEEERGVVAKALEAHLTDVVLDDLYYKRDGSMILDRLVYLGSKRARAFVTKAMHEDLVGLEDMKARGRLFNLGFHYVDKPYLTRLIIEVVGSYLESQFGVRDGKSIVKRWKSEMTIEFRNIDCIRRIEEQITGAAKMLNEEYGICEFERYPIDMLVEQARNHDKDVPFGIVMFPREDHNDAFDNNLDILQQLHDETKGKHITRVYEISRKSSIMRFLVDLRNKFKKKISYMILAGHGHKDGMEFSWHSRLDTDMLARSTSTEAIKDMFIDQPSVVLLSCSTGAEQGFAQALSERLGARVDAPKTPSSLKSLSVHYDNKDKPTFNVEFHVNTPEEQAVYMRGIKE